MRPVRSPRVALSALGVIVASVMVLQSAWVAEDAFINFRVASNIFAGFGPVYNVGQRVQVFTSPLWMAATLGYRVFHVGVYLWCIILGVALTAAAFAMLGKHLLADGRPVAPYLLLGVVLLSSDAFVSFQTSGLEDSLVTLLLVSLVVLCDRDGDDPRRCSWISAVCCLLLLTRQDQLFMLAPLLLTLAVRGRLKEVGAVLLPLLPLVAWEAFSVIYYGSLLPNTAITKLGALPLSEAIRQGIAYVADFIHFEPIQDMAIAAALLLGASVWRRPRGGRQALLLSLCVGCLLQLCYVVIEGGDYMRGRFLDSILVCAALLGAVALREVPELQPKESVLAVLCLLSFGLYGLREANMSAEATIQPDGIVNERAFWNVNLGLFERSRTLSNSGDGLRAYADANGPITVHLDTIGQVGYLAGPKVTIVDEIGIADPVAARAPTYAGSRIGHPIHTLPPSYYAAIHDVSTLPNWGDRLGKMDPTLRTDALRDTGSDVPPDVSRLMRDEDIIVSGPLWSRERWDLIGRSFLFPLRVDTAP